MNAQLQRINHEIRQLPWNLWVRQTVAIARLDLRKCLRARRLIGIYVLTLLPILICAMAAFVSIIKMRNPNEIRLVQIYAAVFQTFIMRFVIVLGAAVIFTQLFRGEVQDKTLHYYFLSPVRREVLVAGKFLAGFATAVIFMCFSVVGSYLLLFLPMGSDVVRQHFVGGQGVTHFITYILVTTLACLGYGAVFTLTGMIFRNPVLPVLGFMGLEGINFLLPPFLKKFSVVHYIQSLCPVPIPGSPLAFLAEPTPGWISTLGVLVFSTAVILFSAFWIRKMEVSYATD